MAGDMPRAAAAQALWDALESHGSAQVFRRHSLIYTPQQPAHTLYLLRGGAVSLYLVSPGGRALTLQVVEPGQLFGQVVFAASPLYDSYAEAQKTVKVVAVPAAEVQRALYDQPALGRAMIEALGQHQLTVSRRLDELAFKSVSARIASVLLDMAEPDPGEHQPSRVPRPTHQQLAEMVNAYRETVTKVISQFRAAHLLDIDRSEFRLLNPSRLRELAQS